MVAKEKEKTIVEKLARLRKEKKLSLDDISRKGAIPVQLVEQIEKGMVSPSIGALKRITRALEIPLADFFQQTGVSDEDIDGLKSEKNAVLTRNASRNVLEVKGSKTVIQYLTPIEVDRKLELLWQEVEPHASGGDWLTHQGEECCFVISGIVRVYVEDSVYDLQKGDALWFKTNQRHKWENPSDQKTILIWAITPPYHGNI